MWSNLCNCVRISLDVEICSVYTLLTYSLTYLLIYSLNPWSRVLLENLTGLQLVKKFSTFYGTRKLITELTSARHLSLS
jgi:hypothetical protein